MPYLGNTPAENFVSVVKQDITGNGSTSYTLNHSVSSPGELEVFVNNVQQEPTTAYTVSGSTLTFSEAVASTDDIYVIFRGRTIGTTEHPAGAALTATSGSFTGDLTVDTNTLFVDAANNRVGVGSVSPDTNLDIERSSNNTGGIKVQNTNNSQANAVAQIEISGGDNAYANLLMECNSTNHSIRQDGSGNLKFINASTERLRIDASGRVTMPNQPDFWTDKTNGSQTLNPSTKITFNGIRRNNGNHYSTSNSRFTAPVTGRYLFCFNAVLNNEGSNNVRVAEMGFLKNNAHRYGFSSFVQENWNASNEHPAVNTTDIIYLNTNDYVEVYTFSHWDSGGGTLAVRNNSASFSGYLLG